MKRVLKEHETRVGTETIRSVEFVRVGSFQVKVTVHEPVPECSGVFDLKAGFTPGTQRAIKEWYEPILKRCRSAEPEPPRSPDISPPPPDQEPVQRVHAASSFMGTLRRLVPVHHRS